MQRTIKFRRGTAVEWTNINPILAVGELGYEIDTDQFKIGNGTSPWEDRPYHVDENAVTALISAAIGALPGGGNAESMIGDLDDLTTTEKGTVVGAINEVNTAPIPLPSLYATAKD